jgi:hypothetical protein
MREYYSLSEQLPYDTEIILSKLIKDGYVDLIKSTNKMNFDYYKITWDGKEFF